MFVNRGNATSYKSALVTMCLNKARKPLTNVQVRVPTVYWENTSPRVITLEYMPGT